MKDHIEIERQGPTGSWKAMIRKRWRIFISVAVTLFSVSFAVDLHLENVLEQAITSTTENTIAVLDTMSARRERREAERRQAAVEIPRDDLVGASGAMIESVGRLEDATTAVSGAVRDLSRDFRTLSETVDGIATRPPAPSPAPRTIRLLVGNAGGELGGDSTFTVDLDSIPSDAWIRIPGTRVGIFPRRTK